MENKETILISVEEAREILGVGRNMIYCNLLRRDDFPAFKIPGCNKYFINREALQSWADKQSGIR